MNKHFIAFGFIAAVLFQPTAKADQIVQGLLNATGAATVNLTSIDFFGNQLTINGPAAVQQGGFTALAGTTAAIGNIVNPPDAPGPLNIPNFITFAADPNISITLTYLGAGIEGSAGCAAGTPAAGQVCTPDTPVLSPFNFQNTTATSSTASFDMFGTEVDNTTGDTALVVGSFTLPFTNMSYQDILNTLEGGGSVTTTFAAQFAVTGGASIQPTIPEPATVVQFLGGLCLLALWKRQRHNTSRPAAR